jgi:di/tricarboxylate transporter
MGADGWIVLAILAAAILAFASNRVRVDAVALGVLLALAITGSVTVDEGLAGFSDPAVLMIGGLFVVGEGIVATGVAAALGDRLATAGQGGETRLIFLLMVVVATFGAFMSSTGIVAIFIPVVLGLASQTGFSRSRLMMPLSVAALISGLMTLIATAPNLIVTAALAERGLRPLGFFELTPICIVILVLAIGYMVTLGRRQLNRPEPPTQRASISADELIAGYGLRGRFRALRVGEGSPLIGQTIADAAVRTRYGVTLTAIGRQQRSRFGVMPALADSVMQGNDVLVVTADAEALSRFAVTECLMEEPIRDRMRSAALQELGVAEVMLAPDAPVIGMSLRKAQFRKRRGLTVLAIKRRGEVLEGNLIETPMKFGDLVLVAGGWPLIARLQEDPGEFVVLRLPEELKSVAPTRAKAPLAVAILAVLTGIIAAQRHCRAACGSGRRRHWLRAGERCLSLHQLVDSRPDRRNAPVGHSARKNRRHGGDGHRPYRPTEGVWAVCHARGAVPSHRSRRPLCLEYRDGGATCADRDWRCPDPWRLTACLRGYRRRCLVVRLCDARLIPGEYPGTGARTISFSGLRQGRPAAPHDIAHRDRAARRPPVSSRVSRRDLILGTVLLPQ